jgi:hypothetical protein
MSQAPKNQGFWLWMGCRVGTHGKMGLQDTTGQ